MTGLAAKRRWINVSRVDQSFLNPRQAAYQTVVPGAFIEGAHIAEAVKNCPWFRETTAHLVQKELYALVQEENDVQLLKHLAVVEKYTGKRETCVKMIDTRIKVLSEGKTDGHTINHTHA